MVTEFSNYRNYLRNVLLERQTANPQYSMRAFAAQIGLGQSALSQVLAGKKNLSLETATKVAGKLRLSETESEYFRVLVQIETSKDPDLKRSLLARAQDLNPNHEVRELSVDFFSVISDWYHLAIKNLIDLEGFEFSVANLAARLGISKLEAGAAMERLLRLELIESDPSRPGNYRKVQNYTVTKSAVPSEALRRFHRQMLEKAMDAIETQSPQEKFIGSETFAFSEENLGEASALAEDFFSKMIQLADRTKAKNEVYHLGVQLFKLTKGGN